MSETQFVTPIQLATLLQSELKPITGNNVPPQMVYNYLKNNVRNINSFATTRLVSNKDGSKRNQTVFEIDKATEFVAIMVSAAEKRIAKKLEQQEK